MKKIFTAVASIIFAFLFGCTEKPNSTIGNNLIDPSQLELATFSAESDTTFYRSITTGYGTSNLVGRISANEELISLFNFEAPRHSYFDSLKGARIDTAELRLIVNYRWNPATTDSFLFDVKEILSPWSESGVTSDSLEQSKLLIGNAPIGTFNAAMNYNQHVSAFLLLDTTVIRRWIQAYTDTGKMFYGFAVQARTGTNTGIIGFTTFNPLSSIVPTLVIRFTRNNIRDSIGIAIANGEDSYVAKLSSPIAYSRIEVRGGFGVRSKIKFNIDSLIDTPLSKKPNVGNATVEMTLNSAASSIYGFSPDTLITRIAISSTDPNLDSSSFFAYGIRRDTLGTINPVYTFSITKIAQRWINQLSSNEGLTLRWGPETSSADRAVFFRHNDVDIKKRPLLKILYSKN